MASLVLLILQQASSNAWLHHPAGLEQKWTVQHGGSGYDYAAALEAMISDQVCKRSLGVASFVEVSPAVSMSESTRDTLKYIESHLLSVFWRFLFRWRVISSSCLIRWHVFICLVHSFEQVGLQNVCVQVDRVEEFGFVAVRCWWSLRQRRQMLPTENQL